MPQGEQASHGAFKGDRVCLSLTATSVAELGFVTL